MSRNLRSEWRSNTKTNEMAGDPGHTAASIKEFHMRRSVTLAFALLLAVGLVGPASAVVDLDAYPVPGVSVTTDNVTHVGYMGDLGPTVSAAIVHLEDESRLYVSSIARGLSIYNIDDPEFPILMGTFPIAGFQNEDMSVSEDGDFAIVLLDLVVGMHPDGATRLIVEYAAGFAFGLFIFQSLFMRDMMGGSYRAALRHSVLPEWLSMNAMMAADVAVVVADEKGRPVPHPAIVIEKAAQAEVRAWGDRFKAW